MSRRTSEGVQARRVTFRLPPDLAAMVEEAGRGGMSRLLRDALLALREVRQKRMVVED